MAKAWFRFKRASQPTNDAPSAAAGSAASGEQPSEPTEPTEPTEPRSAEPTPSEAPLETVPELAIETNAETSAETPETPDEAVVASSAEPEAESVAEPAEPAEPEAAPAADEAPAPPEAPSADEPDPGAASADDPTEEPAAEEELALGDEQAPAVEEGIAEEGAEQPAEQPAEAEPAGAEAPEPLELSLGAERSAEQSALPSYVDTQSAGDWLARLAQISAVTAYKALSYNLLDLKPGERAVDVGCGLGADARQLALRVGPTGSVVGVDGSAEMIARATEATDADTARTLRFVTADATALPFETSAFDALRADRLLQHVDDPLQALVEFRRVLRHGARIVLVEPDWKTMAVYPGSADGADDDHCVAAIFDWQVAHTRHPLIGRQLRMLLALAGFVSVSVTPVAYASTRFIEADLTLELSRAALGAAEQWPARLSRAEAEAWRVTAQAADAAGHFFASVPLFFAHATVE